MATHTFDAADVALEGWLSGFLHDMACAWDHDAFDHRAATLSIKVRRLYYEEPHYREGRCLFRAVPLTKFRTMPSVLVVRNVQRARIEPRQVRFGMWSERAFSYAELRGLELLLAFEGGDIELTLSGWAPITLLDTGPPSSAFEHTYVGWALEDHDQMIAAMRDRRCA